MLEMADTDDNVLGVESPVDKTAVSVENVQIEHSPRLGEVPKAPRKIQNSGKLQLRTKSSGTFLHVFA